MTTKNVHEFIEHENKAVSHLQIRHYQPKKLKLFLEKDKNKRNILENLKERTYVFEQVFQN
jgi:hypothetical protein